MTSLYFMLMIAGFLVSTAGYIWLIVEAFRMGVLYVIGLILVPCFPFIMLIGDVKRVWMPLFLNTFGGVVSTLAMLRMAMSAAPPPSRHVPSPYTDVDPVLPGSYVPPVDAGTIDPGFLAQVDPMVFAFAGGVMVFMLVGTVVGTVLLFTMKDETEADAPVEPAG